MMKIKTPKTKQGARAPEKCAPKLVENGKKTLILHGTKTSNVLNTILTQIYHLKRESAIKYTKKNENISPFESGGETRLEFFSLKNDCSLFVDLDDNYVEHCIKHIWKISTISKLGGGTADIMSDMLDF